jgi:hypothetical protein
MNPAGIPAIKGQDAKELRIEQPIEGGGEFLIVCAEDKIKFTATDVEGKPLRWAWKLVGGAKQKSLMQSITTRTIDYSFAGTKYDLRLPHGSGSCRQLQNGDVELVANNAGMLVLLLDGTVNSPIPR